MLVASVHETANWPGAASATAKAMSMAAVKAVAAPEVETAEGMADRTEAATKVVDAG